MTENKVNSKQKLDSHQPRQNKELVPLSPGPGFGMKSLTDWLCLQVM